jgi:hypothetical protein
MTSDPLEAYLSRLEHELTKYRLVSARILEEARDARLMLRTKLEACKHHD